MSEKSTNPLYEFLQKIGLMVLIPVIIFSFTLASDVKVLQIQQVEKEKTQDNINKKLDLLIEFVSDLKVGQAEMHSEIDNLKTQIKELNSESNNKIKKE